MRPLLLFTPLIFMTKKLFLESLSKGERIFPNLMAVLEVERVVWSRRQWTPSSLMPMGTIAAPASMKPPSQANVSRSWRSQGRMPLSAI